MSALLVILESGGRGEFFVQGFSTTTALRNHDFSPQRIVRAELPCAVNVTTRTRRNVHVETHIVIKTEAERIMVQAGNRPYKLDHSVFAPSFCCHPDCLASTLYRNLRVLLGHIKEAHQYAENSEAAVHLPTLASRYESSDPIDTNMCDRRGQAEADVLATIGQHAEHAFTHVVTYAIGADCVSYNVGERVLRTWDTIRRHMKERSKGGRLPM